MPILVEMEEIQMSKAYNVRQGMIGNGYVGCVGLKEPIAHPVNCKNECPYGYNRAFCFPCMLKIERECKTVRKARNMEV